MPGSTPWWTTRGQRERSVILDEILAHKRRELARVTRRVPLQEVERAARFTSHRRQAAGERDRFREALRQPGVSLIAEAKMRSPSKGMLREEYDAAHLAVVYAGNGASAGSILTDSRYFGGDVGHVRAARGALAAEGLDLPLLRKDFILTDYQLYESVACGADAVLLICAALSDNQLKRLLTLADELAIDALVETHDALEIERATGVGAQIVGVNSRDLRDFTVDHGAFGRLRARIPPGVIAVAESGVRDAHDITRLRDAGADAVLVGAAIVTATDPGAKVRELARGGAV